MRNRIKFRNEDLIESNQNNLKNLDEYFLDKNCVELNENNFTFNFKFDNKNNCVNKFNCSNSNLPVICSTRKSSINLDFNSKSNKNDLISKNVLSTFENENFNFLNNQSNSENYLNTNNLKTQLNLNQANLLNQIETKNQLQLINSNSILNQTNQSNSPSLIKFHNQNKAHCLSDNFTNLSNLDRFYSENFIRKRNERERARVRNVNDGFDRLRKHLPNELEYKKDKRLSKVQTLKLAIIYIKKLESILQL